MNIFPLTMEHESDGVTEDAMRCDAAERMAAAEDCICGEKFESLHFRESPRIEAVAGRSGRLETEVFTTPCDDDGVPVVRRSSGGGTVLVGPGCLVYSLILDRRRPEMNGIEAIHDTVLRRIIAALQPLTTATIRREGTCDLTLTEPDTSTPAPSRKFSGNAVRLRTRTILYHGTILYDFPLEKMARYLREPPRRPEYRAGRTHDEFLANFPAPRDAILHALTATFYHPPGPPSEGERSGW